MTGRGNVREQEMLVTVKRAEPNRCGRWPGCRYGSSAQFELCVEAFCYVGGADSGQRSDLVHRTLLCEDCLRKSGPEVASAFIESAISSFFRKGAA